MAIAAFTAAPASAASPWHVNDSGDSGDGTCEDLPMECTLRDAVGEADDGEIVIIDPGVTPFLGNEIPVSTDITIEGQGPTASRIRTQNTSRILNVTPGTDLKLEHLSVEQGRVSDGEPGASGTDGQSGGGIISDVNTTLELDDVLMRGNLAGNGGAASTSNGGNGGSGGAIKSDGAVVIRNSTLEKNYAGDGGDTAAAAGDGGDGGDGGAVLVGGPGSLAVHNSTIADNVSGRGGDSDTGTDGGDSGFGGGIFTQGNTLTVVNSTIAGNTTGVQSIGGVAGQGGGIWDGSGSSTLVHTTVAGNSAIGAFLPGSTGGGIYRFVMATMTVRNSLFVDNTAFTGRNCGASGTIVNGGGNLMWPDPFVFSGCNFTLADPKLQPLSSNGGPTQTMALGAGSAAIDNVPLATCAGLTPAPLGIDQRGLPRPSGSACDSGALEVQQPPVPAVSTPPLPVTPALPAAAAVLKKCKRGQRLKKGKCVRKKKK